MMGEFKAEFPNDRLYATNHMWAMPQNGPIESEIWNSIQKIGDHSGEDDHPAGIQFLEQKNWKIGFGAYAVRLLQDVYFLDWDIDAPAMVKKSQEIGSIESKKAESSLYCPSAGTITEFNELLLDDPSGINVDKYGSGWLMIMETESSSFMSASQYVQHLDSVWEQTQRTIKGQANT